MAIVTDKLRLINCSNFINDVASGRYFMFIGLPNSTYFYSNWDSSRPDPIDNYFYLNSYSDNILAVKKVNSSDVVRVIPKIVWQRGKIYEMYRHDYSVYNTTPITSSTRLYDSSYYVMNRDYRVYICINNNSLRSNLNRGTPSTEEPLHTDLSPRLESDGYMWKYLYTLSPSDFLKFDSTEYISLPNNWETSENSEIERIREGSVNGKIETILIESNSVKYPYTGTLTQVPIKGDGEGGLASVEFDEQGSPIKVTVTEGGSGYTFATLDLDSIIPPSSNDINDKSIFNVIIPPPGGHGKNIYNELGSFRCLIYCRIENEPTNPDFMVGNQFSRIGIIKDILFYNTNSQFTDNIGSGLCALKLNEDASDEDLDSLITQENTGAIGNIVSFDVDTKILKFIQPRSNNIDTYVDNISGNIQIDYHISKSIDGIQKPESYSFSNFDNSPVKIGNNTYSVDTSFSGNTLDVGEVTYYLGQTFSNGVSYPDINIKSGDIVYVDNRTSITRSSQQREDIKIILEF